MAWVYCTTADVEEYSGIARSSLKDMWSEIVEGLINERYGGTSIGSTAQHTESYDGSGTDTLYLDHFPVTSVSSLSIDSVNIDSSSYVTYEAGYIKLVHGGVSELYDAAGLSYSRFPVGQKNVAVVYTAGEALIPSKVRWAAILMVTVIANMYNRAGSDASLSFDFGSSGNVGEQDRGSRYMDVSGKLNSIMNRTLGRGWRFE